MSWLSVAWTRNKNALGNVARTIPIVGGVVAGAIDNIRTGDERKDPTTGTWISNATGQPVQQVPTGALQAQIDQTNDFNRTEWDRVRGQLSDLTAKIGIVGAAKVGPSGNPYQTALNMSPMTMGVIAVAIIGTIYLVSRKH